LIDGVTVDAEFPRKRRFAFAFGSAVAQLAGLVGAEGLFAAFERAPGFGERDAFG
jgi:hypothetical protein